MPDAPRSATGGERRARPPLGRNVVALGVVSFFTDFSSEMIYPLLPLFLTSQLGASASFVGAIEGAAESTASLLKLASGWWSDRVSRRKPLVVLGYSIASLVRPLIAAAQSPVHVLLIRVSDRVGKGIRASPRDALIADSVDPSIRGRAFGFHRALDHLGAVIGPLVAFIALRHEHLPLRQLFWWAALPGLLSVIVLVAAVRDVPSRDGSLARPTPPRDYAHRPRGAPPNNDDTTDAAGVQHRFPAADSEPLRIVPPLGGRFWAFLGVVLLFTLGNSTDAFLILRANALGVPVALVPILWAMLHVVKSASSTPSGTLSDSLGRRPLIIAGWALYAAVYLGFGAATRAWHAWALFAVYGVFFGLTEGTERALVADLVPAARRGAAFGWYNLAIGLGALPASVIFGIIWDRASPATAFAFGASLALLAAVGVAVVVPPRRIDVTGAAAMRG